MKQLKEGLIYSFKYNNYKKDPNPLVLVLYSDQRICHALNFHYLHGDLNMQLIQMISRVASKKLRIKSMYAHYHHWMKKNIPGVIRVAYRTYKPNFMSGVQQITSGFWGTNSFMQSMIGRRKLKLTETQKRIAEKIDKKKLKEGELYKEKVTRKLSYNPQNIENYVSLMNKIVQEGKKTDKTKFTYAYGKHK